MPTATDQSPRQNHRTGIPLLWEWNIPLPVPVIYHPHHLSHKQGISTLPPPLSSYRVGLSFRRRRAFEIRRVSQYHWRELRRSIENHIFSSALVAGGEHLFSNHDTIEDDVPINNCISMVEGMSAINDGNDLVEVMDSTLEVNGEYRRVTKRLQLCEKP